MLRPTATGHTLQGHLPPPRKWEVIFSGGSIRSRGAALPVFSDPDRGADSTPIDRRFATVLAHTPWRNTSGRDLLRHLHPPALPQMLPARDTDQAHPRRGSDLRRAW